MDAVAQNSQLLLTATSFRDHARPFCTGLNIKRYYLNINIATDRREFIQTRFSYKWLTGS